MAATRPVFLATITGVTASRHVQPRASSSDGGAPGTNGCAVTQIFTISAADACGNTATAYGDQ